MSRLQRCQSRALGELLSHFGCQNPELLVWTCLCFVTGPAFLLRHPRKRRRQQLRPPFFRHVAYHFKPQGRLHDGHDGDANICKIHAAAQLPIKTKGQGRLSEGTSFRK